MEEFQRSIFVAKLPTMVNRSSNLQTYFEKFGKIDFIRYEGRSAIFWFDDFSALKGIFEHGRHIIDGHFLNIGLPNCSNEIFVSNIPFETQELDLLEQFSKYGKIDTITTTMKNDSVQCAFIKFATNDGFKAVINAYKAMAENTMKVNVAYRKLMVFEPPKEYKVNYRCKKMYAEVLPQTITDKQIKAYFSKFDYIDSFIRKDYKCQLTFASINGLKKVLDTPEHKSNGTIIYVKAFEQRRFIPFEQLESLPEAIDDGKNNDFGKKLEATYLVKDQQQLQPQNEERSTEIKESIKPIIPPQNKECLTEEKESMEKTMPPQNKEHLPEEKESIEPTMPPQNEKRSTEKKKKKPMKTTMPPQNEEHETEMKATMQLQNINRTTMPGFKFTYEDSKPAMKFGSPEHVANLKETLAHKEDAIMKYFRSTFKNSYLFH